MGLKESQYPVDERGRPDLSYYSDSPEYYAAMHRQFREATRSRDHDSRLEFGRRVHACWGLIAQGRAAIPYALEMLKSDNASAREDAGGILAAIGKDPNVVPALLEQLGREQDMTARDVIILALGALKDRAAVPALAALVRDEATDPDTRWTAMESLGKIVRRRFYSEEDPLRSAIEWLDRKGIG